MGGVMKKRVVGVGWKLVNTRQRLMAEASCKRGRREEGEEEKED